MQIPWTELKLEAVEFKKIIERERMLRRYQRMLEGRLPLADRIHGALAKVRTQLETSWRGTVKRSLDIVVSAFGILISIPAMAVIAFAIRLDSKGPTLFKQTRVGMRGRSFNMMKFRTMVQDAEAKTGPVWAQEHDPRITPIGRFLRKTHLDELPQLFNVIQGEMSLVGPRPERPYFVSEFRRIIPHYDRRLCAKPGITGLAQVKRGYDQNLADVKKKVKYDLLYIQKMCPLLDFKVLAMTVGAVLLRTGR